MKMQKKLSLAVDQYNNKLQQIEVLVSKLTQNSSALTNEDKQDNNLTITNKTDDFSAEKSALDTLNELNKFFSELSAIESINDEPNFTGGSSNKATQEPHNRDFKKLFTPQEIKSYLDKYVVGQEQAKKVLSVAAYNHQRRVNGLDSKKSNILLVGPSGSGKTYLIEKLSEILSIPIAYADATTLTQAGYVGEDVDSILANLYYKANNDIELAEIGIVFIDEFDKIQRHKSNSSSLDVGGVGVQQALLKMLEGAEIDVKLDSQKTKVVRINTKNILFICAGAFVGIDKVIKSRLQPNKRRIGFTDEDFSPKEELNDFNKLLPKVNSDDVINFGFIPEIMGRIPLVAGLEKLSEEDLVNILTNTQDNLIDEFSSIFNYGDRSYQLNFTKQSISEIAKLAIKREVGARGLRSIFENLLLDAMYEVPSFNHDDTNSNQVKSLLITKENVTKNTPVCYATAEVTDNDILDESTSKYKDFIKNFSLKALEEKAKVKVLANKSKKAKPKKSTKTTKTTKTTNSLVKTKKK